MDLLSVPAGSLTTHKKMFRAIQINDSTDLFWNSRAHSYCKHWNREILGPNDTDQALESWIYKWVTWLTISKGASKTPANVLEPHGPSMYSLSMDLLSVPAGSLTTHKKMFRAIQINYSSDLYWKRHNRIACPKFRHSALKFGILEEFNCNCFRHAMKK